MTRRRRLYVVASGDGMPVRTHSDYEEAIVDVRYDHEDVSKLAARITIQYPIDAEEPSINVESYIPRTEQNA